MDQQLPSEKNVDPRDVSTFDRVRDETEAFERILQAHGIEIAAGSPLERMCFSLLELTDRIRTAGDTLEDLRVAYRPAFGLHDLLRRVVRLEKHPDFPVLIDHLRLLNTGSVAQNVAAPTDQIAAKVFELLVGLICLEVGTNTELDHPVRAYGDNPDILTTAAGRRWGFACKVVSGRSPITLFDRIEEGIDQIEKSPAEKGWVFISLKNVIDHEVTWPLLNGDEYAAGRETPTYGAAASVQQPLGVLQRTSLEVQRQLVATNGRENVQKLFLGKKSIPGVVFFLQTATSLQFAEGPVNTVLGLFHLMDEGVDDESAHMLIRMNDALHHH